MKNIWSILGIEPTTDLKVIRQAYARMSKIYHPEEQPEQFRLVYEAYRTALDAASKNQSVESRFEFKEDEIEEQVSEPTSENAAAQTQDYQYDFESVVLEEGQIFQDPNHAQWQLVIQEIAVNFKKKQNNRLFWRKWLKDEKFTSVMSDPDFVSSFTKFLKRKHLAIKAHVFSEIKKAYTSAGYRNKDSAYTSLFSALHAKQVQAKDRMQPNRKVIVASCLVAFPLVIGVVFGLILNKGPNESSPDSYVYDTYPVDTFIDDDTTSGLVAQYLLTQYPDYDLKMASDSTTEGQIQAYNCDLEDLGGLKFQAFASVSGENIRISDNIIESAVIESLKLLKLYYYYGDSKGTVFIPYSDRMPIEQISELLVCLPDTILETYPFLEGAEVCLCIVPRDTPYPYANYTARKMPTSKSGWLASKETAISALRSMETAYIIDYEPWDSAYTQIPEQERTEYLQYGNAVVAEVDKTMRVFEDIRVIDGDITAGNVYRLCKSLNIPVSINEDGVLTVTDQNIKITFSKWGTTTLSAVSQTLDIPLTIK